MCGIFALLNNENEFTDGFIQHQFQQCRSRGPEFSVLTKVGIKVVYGFHRLAINGLNAESNQPINHDNIILICNGEIYNYKELYQQMNIVPDTQSDCEVIVHLYKRYGIDQTLQLLDGVFSFALLDQRIENADSRLYVARDPYGVRPLYSLHSTNRKENVIGFASELKSLSNFVRCIPNSEYTVSQFEPGTYSSYILPFQVSSEWTFEKTTRYHTTSFGNFVYNNAETPFDSSQLNNIIVNIQKYLLGAVEKRCNATERPIACLLSGGLDSSLIAALVNDFHIKHNLPPIETYSIGLEGSEDLRCASIVAQHIGTRHTQILLTESDFLEAIPEVIRTIESYDTTSVRASIGNYLLGKYISSHSDAKVIFNGDGSDELCGGYLYMKMAPDALEFDKECRRLLKDIHTFDVLCSDKSISSHGLEPRTPFLDRAWTQYYLSIPANIRFNTTKNNCEKYLLRTAFDFQYYLNSVGKPLLPNEILWRRKEAFSDGVSDKSRSLYEIIQEFTTKQLSAIPNVKTEYAINKPLTHEEKYYRILFELYYPNCGHIVPYFWMPKYVNATDASARTLAIYEDNDSQTNK
jgi:asparagine synthase (glutamine-hydrolysing)